MRKQTLHFVRLSAALLAAVLVMTGFSAPVEGFDKDQILEPFNNDIALCKEAIGELDRQAAQRKKQFEETRDFFKGLKNDLDAFYNRLSEEHAQKKAIGELLATSASRLAVDAKGTCHLPVLGWTTPDGIATFQAGLEKIRAGDEEKFKAGEMAFNLFSIGFMSAKDLDKKAESFDRELAKLQASIECGSFTINFPGVGFTTRQGLEKRIADHEKKIAQTLEKIEKGEYSLNIPHIGWATKKEVEARLNKLEAQIASVSSDAGRESVRFHRPQVGWSGLAELNAALGKKAAETGKLQKSLEDKSFSVRLGTMGYVSAKILEDNIGKAQAAIEGIKKALEDNTYGVPLGLGMAGVTGKDIQTKLDSKNIEEWAKEPFRKALRHMTAKAEIEISLLQLEIGKLQKWLAAIPEFTKPLEKRIALETGQLKDLMNENSSDAQFVLKQLERQRDWLKKCLAMFP